MGDNTGSCCGGNTTKNTMPQDLTLTARPAQNDETIAECRVMPGTPVVKAVSEAKGLYRDYQGNRYWLCCPGCGPAFDADPAKYAKAG